MNQKFVILLLLSAVIAVSTGCRVKTIVTAKDMDMSGVHNHAERTTRFYNFLRPVVESENNRIRTLRQSLLAARQENNRKAFVERVAKEYKVPWSEDNPNWTRLLARVDIIPPQIALAQSAIETDWGRSRFALEGNNFFGQWCYVKNCGMVPAKRDVGKNHEVTRYHSVNASVRSYMKNLNTTAAYSSFRAIRRKQRESHKPFDPLALADGLKKYSQRHGQYVKAIKHIIIRNRHLFQPASKPATPQRRVSR